MNQVNQPNQLEISKQPEIALPSKPDTTPPIVKNFDGSIDIEWRKGHFLRTRGFHLEDYQEIKDKIDQRNRDADHREGEDVAGELAMADTDQKVVAATVDAQEANRSSALNANNALSLKNLLLELSNGGSILGSETLMPRMWMVEGESLATLLWMNQADVKGPLRDTVNDANDQVDTRVDYAFGLSQADLEQMHSKFPEGSIKECSYGAPNFQAEIAGIRFLFLNYDMEKMNAMTVASKDNKTAANDNQ